MAINPKIRWLSLVLLFAVVLGACGEKDRWALIVKSKPLTVIEFESQQLCLIAQLKVDEFLVGDMQTVTECLQLTGDYVPVDASE